MKIFDIAKGLRMWCMILRSNHISCFIPFDIQLLLFLIFLKHTRKLGSLSIVVARIIPHLGLVHGEMSCKIAHL